MDAARDAARWLPAVASLLQHAPFTERLGHKLPIEPGADLDAPHLGRDQPLSVYAHTDTPSQPIVHRPGVAVAITFELCGVVELSFAWMTRCRRLVKDYELYAQTPAGLHFVAFACIMLKRAAELMQTALEIFRKLPACEAQQLRVFK